MSNQLPGTWNRRVHSDDTVHKHPSLIFIHTCSHGIEGITVGQHRRGAATFV